MGVNWRATICFGFKIDEPYLHSDYFNWVDFTDHVDVIYDDVENGRTILILPGTEISVQDYGDTICSFEPGVRPSHRVPRPVPYSLFLEELKKRGVKVEEEDLKWYLVLECSY